VTASSFKTMSNKLTIEISKKKMVIFMSVPFLFVGGTAFGLSATNTPNGGYLVCVSKSSKVLTYPGALKCPSGSSQLVLGAQGAPGQNGVDGAPGVQGPAGVANESTDYVYRLASKDIVFDGTANTLAEGKRTVMATIRAVNLPDKGYYELYAHLAGIWSSSAPANALLYCYFQSESDYLANITSTSSIGPTRYGAASTEHQRWSGINIDVRGDASDYSLSQSPIDLICATTGSVSGLSGVLDAFRFDGSQGMNLSP